MRFYTALPLRLRAPLVGLFIGSSIPRFTNPIRNDYGNFPPVRDPEPLHHQVHDVARKYDRKVNHHELAIGSMSGLLFGVLIGKFSKVILSFTALGALLLRFLTSRNIIKLPTMGRYVNKEKLQRLLERPSFNICFVLSFAVAFMNV